MQCNHLPDAVEIGCVALKMEVVAARLHVERSVQALANGEYRRLEAEERLHVIHAITSLVVAPRRTLERHVLGWWEGKRG